jgi:hypothetical protein
MYILKNDTPLQLRHHTGRWHVQSTHPITVHENAAWLLLLLRACFRRLGG